VIDLSTGAFVMTFLRHDICCSRFFLLYVLRFYVILTNCICICVSY